MTNSIVEISQLKAAKVAGFMFLFTMATSIPFYIIRSGFFVYGNAAETAKNLVANEGLFRITIAADIITFASIIILPLALYILLKPVSKNLALLGLFWRLGEAIVLFIISLNSLFVLRLLSGAEYLAVFEKSQLHAQVMLYLGVFGTGFEIGLILFGLGSTVFNYLFFKSRYIPRILAAWGIFASIFLLVCTFAILLLPNYAAMLRRIVYIPIFVDEVVLSLWLLFKGVKVQQPQ